MNTINIHLAACGMKTYEPNGPTLPIETPTLLSVPNEAPIEVAKSMPIESKIIVPATKTKK